MHELTLYQRILESNLINFIIMVSILTLIFKKAKLGAIFDKMADDIKTSVMTSSEAAQNAIKEYKEAKRSTKNLQLEKDEILSKANTGAENMQKTAQVQIEKEEKLLDEKCSAQIENNIKKTKNDSASEILDEILNKAEKEIKNRIQNDENNQLQRKFIEKSIEEIDKIEKIKF